MRIIALILKLGVSILVHSTSPTGLEHYDCIEDFYMNNVKGINNFLRENTDIKKALLIAGGALSDVLIVGMLSYWALCGRSWRMPISLVCLYILRHMTSVRNTFFVNGSLFDIVCVEDQISG